MGKLFESSGQVGQVIDMPKTYTSNFTSTNPIVKSSSQFIPSIMNGVDASSAENEWSQVFESAVFFKGSDQVLGNVIAMIYQEKNTKSKKLSAMVISKHGYSLHHCLNVSSDSKYYQVVCNLPTEMRSSNVRKSLAVALLQTFANIDRYSINALYTQAHLPFDKFDWDETKAGELASKMELIRNRDPQSIGNFLCQLGFFSNSILTGSYIVDVVYSEDESRDKEESNSITEKNNAMAFLLGEQLDQLFDSLAEYSPEPTEKVYKPPLVKNNSDILHGDSDLIRQICSELITIQSNFTVSIVQFLQKFIVPLRMQVLEGNIKGYTIKKLNKILPPTIDEVTRINCIFLDMLKLAEPFGSYEILKASGTTIPYFYKAQMRHEAATKNFRDNYKEFIQDMKSIGKEKLLTYDQRSIETIVYSSLHLCKLQLILNRLYKSKDWPSEYLENVNQFLKSCDNTISSFNNDKLTPYNGRIFTPTGKILAEVANGWPKELQFGWLTRRVVAVFDVTDLLCDNVKNRSVIVIFSDHVLFLSIDDDEYYSNFWEGDLIHKPSVADILMHSLINETPLTNIPHLKVKSWSAINEIDGFYYTVNNESFVKFYFNGNNEENCGVYKFDKVSSRYVTQVLARAKILNKNQAFHLFNGLISNSNDKKIYYTAHNLESYKIEETKSPFLILFNKPFSFELLDTFNVFAIFTLNFISDGKINLEGTTRAYSRDNGKINFQMPMDDLEKILSTLLNELFITHNSLHNPQKILEILSINEKLASDIVKVVDKSDSFFLKERQDIVQKMNNLQLENKIAREARFGNGTGNSKRQSLELLKPKKGVNRSETIKKYKGKGKTDKQHPTSFFKKIFQLGNNKSPLKKSGRMSQLSSTLPAPTPTPTPSPIAKRASTPTPIPTAMHMPSHSPAPEICQTTKSFSSVGKLNDETKDQTAIANVGQSVNTSMSTSIFVNSKFEFPMETANAITTESKEEFKKAPRFGILNDSEQKKSYKDSVDLMGRLEIDIKNDMLSYNDLFGNLREEESKFKLASFELPIVALESNPDLDVNTPITVESDVFSQIKALTPNTPATSKLEYINNEKIKPLSNDRPSMHIQADPALDLASRLDQQHPYFSMKSPIKNNSQAARSMTQSATATISPTAKNNKYESLIKPNVLTENVKLEEAKLTKSQSFYVKFKKLRNAQEASLQKYGLSDISEISEMTKGEFNVFDNQLLNGYIKARTSEDSKVKDNNWTKYDSVKQQLSLKTRVKPLTKSNSVKVKKVETKSDLDCTTDTFFSNATNGSSIYESSIVADLGNFGTIRTNKNFENPYAKPASERETKVDLCEDFFDDLEIEFDELTLPELTDLSNEYQEEEIEEVQAKAEISNAAVLNSPSIKFDELKKSAARIVNEYPIMAEDTSLCSALCGDTQADILLNVWDHGICDQVSRSQSMMELNGLLGHNSYYYLNAFINGELYKE
ncbi:Bud3 protein [Martiniozyma asiatica (nom. inval.)]|nr:Bud3 protein [Martiniozyma asiatica]